jgi:hypothetical protein
LLGHTSHGHPAADLTRDDVLDNITLYWLTGPAVSSARLYWENKISLHNAADMSVRVAVSVFLARTIRPPELGRARVSQPHLLQRGRQRWALRGLEQPQLFSEEVRAGLRPWRK